MDMMIEQIRLRAYELWQLNGMHGCDVAHWTAAETEIMARTKVAAPRKSGKSVRSAAAKSAVRKPTSKKDVGLAASAL